MNELTLDIFNIIIFFSYFTISFSILYVYKTIVAIRKASFQVTALFILWFSFILSCGVSHLFRLKIHDLPGREVVIILCAIFSVLAGGITIIYIRRLNRFIVSQVALVEIFRNDNLNEFMNNFDAVCTISQGRITSGAIRGIRNIKNLEVKGSLRPGNTVRIINEYIRISCVFDGRSSYNQSVKDMMKKTFPQVKLDIEGGNSLVLIIGQNVTKEWESQETQDKIADAKLSLALSTAYDLRSPLMNFELLIGCVITELKNYSKNENLNNLLKEAIINIEVMRNCISQTMDIGRIVSKHILQPKIQKCNIRVLLERLNLMYKAFETRVPIIYTVDDNFPKYISIDSEWLWEICINLLTNACKYTTSGQIDFKLKIVNSLFFEIEIKDTGIGIPFSQRENIFEKFSALQTYNMESTGIGLFIVKKKVELLNGIIEVRDNNDSETGMRFIVKLPLLEYNKENIKIKDEESSNFLLENCEEDRSRDNSTLTMIDIIEDKINNDIITNKSCLIVDNTASVRRIMSKTLERFNRVDTATNGVEGLKMMKSRQYSVVFIDNNMPFMNGIECIKQLRQWEKEIGNRRQYVIMISANCMDISEDFDEYLSKPISYNRLISIVEKSKYVDDS